MRAWMAVGAVVALAWCGGAQAVCRLNPPAALICERPQDAAEAWFAFGRDPTAMDDELSRDLAARARCFAVKFYPNLAAKPVLEFARGRIPNRRGYVEVVGVAIVDRDYRRSGGLSDLSGFVAAAYVEGVCDRQKLEREGRPPAQ